MAELKKENKTKTKKTEAKEKGIRWYLVVLWTVFVIGVASVFCLFYGIYHEWFGDMPTFEELENPKSNLATITSNHCTAKTLRRNMPNNRNTFNVRNLFVFIHRNCK